MELEHVYRMAVLLRGDYPVLMTSEDRRHFLNAVAWGLKEAGWGLLESGDGVLDAIANLPNMQTLRLLNDNGTVVQIADILLVADESLAARFEDPTEPGPIEHPVPDRIPPQTPPVGYVPGSMALPLEGETELELPSLKDLDLVQALNDINDRINTLSSMWIDIVREIGQLLDNVDDELRAIREQLNRGYTGTARVMGISVAISLQPVPAPVAEPVPQDPLTDAPGQ